MITHERPHFLGIGAQKAATTWLHRCLRAHPGLWLPPIKELHYFTHRPHDLNQGIVGRLTGGDWVNRRLRRILKPRLLTDLRRLDTAGLRWDLRFLLGARNDAWYESLFWEGAGRVTGEITPEYSSLSAEEVGTIRNAFPNLRLLYVMRDPIDRAWSQMRMMARRRGTSVGLLSDEECLEMAKDPRIVKRGEYGRTLHNWGCHFPPERLFVAFMEEVRSSPRELLFRILDFLEVARDDSFLPPDLLRPIHQGDRQPIPKAVERELARFHLEDLRNLEKRFGSPTREWRERAERVLAS